MFHFKAALLGYCVYYGNIYRVLNGYDTCGNVCGQNNEFDYFNHTGCRGMNMTKQKYLRMHSWSLNAIENGLQSRGHCVENCDNLSGL